jgi:hypothetical protein
MWADAGIGDQLFEVALRQGGETAVENGDDREAEHPGHEHVRRRKA